MVMRVLSSPFYMGCKVESQMGHSAWQLQNSHYHHHDGNVNINKKVEGRHVPGPRSPSLKDCYSHSCMYTGDLDKGMCCSIV